MICSSQIRNLPIMRVILLHHVFHATNFHVLICPNCDLGITCALCKKKRTDVLYLHPMVELTFSRLKISIHSLALMSDMGLSKHRGP